MGGGDYVPEKAQNIREQTRKLDRFQYYRSKRLYEATGAQQHREEMMNTATGWTQAGLEGTGWAKNRRRSFSPEERHESSLFGQDQGFSSPWQGLKSVDEIADVVKKHDDTILSLGREAKSIDNHMGNISKALRQSSWSVPPKTPNMGAGARQAAESVSASARRSSRLARTDRGLPFVANEGLSDTGMAKALRGENTQIQSGRGFASPYRGEDPEKAVNYRARDPVQQALPPELMTGFGAVPARERDFLRPFMRTADPERQAEIMEMVSPQFGAMLETGWNYTQGRPTGAAAARMRPDPQKRADLTAHPAMGLGSDVEGTKIKTLEDSGIAAQEAGIGWQGAMERMEGAVVEPSAIDTPQDATERNGEVTRKELRQMLKTALMQMGVDATISIQPTDGPTEVHLREHVG